MSEPSESKKNFWDRAVRIWARAIGHLMGQSDDDRPDVPILTQREATIVMLIISIFVVTSFITNIAIVVNIIFHW